MAGKDERAERLKAALRANLRRRKAGPEQPDPEDGRTRDADPAPFPER